MWIPLGTDLPSAVRQRVALEQPADVMKHLRRSFGRISGRALRKKIEFDLTWDDCQMMMSRAAGRCEVSGIPFHLDGIGDLSRRPFAPSVDRIQSKIGYTAANCRLVCVAVNVAMNEWGVDTLMLVLQSIKSLRSRRKAAEY